MPISLHILTGRRGPRFSFRHILRSYMTLPHEIQVSFADLVLSGVFERYPRLRLVSAENDVSWLPHFCYRLDHAYDRLRHFEGVNLPLPPSEYMKRQVWATFQFETGNVGFTCEQYGKDKIMWSLDYPHTDSPWPRSREFIDNEIKSINNEDKRRVVCDNASYLYGELTIGRDSGNVRRSEPESRPQPAAMAGRRIPKGEVTWRNTRLWY